MCLRVGKRITRFDGATMRFPARRSHTQYLAPRLIEYARQTSMRSLPDQTAFECVEAVHTYEPSRRARSVGGRKDDAAVSAISTGSTASSDPKPNSRGPDLAKFSTNPRSSVSTAQAPSPFAPMPRHAMAIIQSLQHVPHGSGHGSRRSPGLCGDRCYSAIATAERRVRHPPVRGRPYCGRAPLDRRCHGHRPRKAPARTRRACGS